MDRRPKPINDGAVSPVSPDERRRVEEKELIGRCLEGDKEAFGDMVRTYEVPLLSLAFGLLGDREEARDAVQDALLQVYVNMKRYDPARSFRTWVFSITYKRCLDKLRRRKYARRTAGAWESRSGPTTAGLLREACFSDNELPAALARLNGPERTALHLRITEDRTAREIAEVLGCSESTARVHLFHAKMKIKKILGKDHHVPDSNVP